MHILRKKEAQDRAGISDVTAWRLEKEGRFPRRFRIAGNRVGYLESEIDAWIEERAAQRESA